MSKKTDYLIWGIALTAALLALASLLIPASKLTSNITTASAVAGIVDIMIAIYLVYSTEEEEEKEDAAKSKGKKSEKE